MNGENLVQVVNTLAGFLLIFSAAFFWLERKCELQPVDRETRKLFTIHWRLHLTSDVDYTLKDGGRGLIALKIV